MTKTTSPKTPGAADLSASERLALEVAGEPTASTPQFRPWIALDRRARAALIRSMGAFVPALSTYLADEAATPQVEPDPDEPAGNAGKAAWAAYAEGLGLAVTPRMTRAAIQAAVAEHRATTAAVAADSGDKVAGLAATFERAADLLELAAGSEDVLRTVAVDADEFARWAAEVDETTLIVTFLNYERTTQLGEAWRSRS